MKKRIILVMVLALIFTSAFSFFADNITSVKAEPAISVLGYLDATVTANFLNVRQGPSTNHKVICVLKKGQSVKVFAKVGDWYALQESGMGCIGVAHGKYLDIAWPKAEPKPTPQPTPQPPQPEPKPEPKPEPTPEVAPPSDATADEKALLDLVNKARADAGAGPLKFDSELLKVARLKAKDMVDKNYFNHDSPTYGSPFDMMRQFNISFRTAGENIAGNRTVDGAFKAWMNSEGHRKNILNGSFNYTGIGIVESSKYGKILVQMFIGR
ncbi:MAG TPA: CAP domain-containing protein [Clostridiales bacterium]|nr:CAP domain-containing protein [Clostridiales bacterium]